MLTKLHALGIRCILQKKRGKKPIKSEIFIDPPRKLEKRGETGIERRYHTTMTNVIRAEVEPVPGFKVLFFFSVHNLLPRPEDGDVSLKRLWRRSQTLIVSSNEDSLSLSSIILKYLQLISRNSLKRPFLIDQMHRFLRMEVYHVAEREREIPLFFGHFKNSVIDSCHDSFRSVTISV